MRLFRTPLTPTEHWYDRVTKITMPRQTRPPLLEPGKSICGAGNLAVTHTHFNTITFCPLMWERELRASLAMFDPPHQLVVLDWYQSFSKIFLHEYTHLVGRSRKFTSSHEIWASAKMANPTDQTWVPMYLM